MSFLERGATVETDILTNIKLLLPPDVTKQLDEIIPPPPNAQPVQQAYEVVTVEEPPVIYTADSVLENQIGEAVCMCVCDIQSQVTPVTAIIWVFVLKDTAGYY